MIDAGWDKELHQLKDKFGGLRIYIGAATQDVHSIVEAAEDESHSICEICGKSGDSVKCRLIRGWYTSICTACGRCEGEYYT